MSKIGKKENGRYLSWKDTSNGPYSWMSKTNLLWDKFTFILLFSCWLLQSSNMNFYANGFYKDTLLVYIYKSCMEVSQTLFLAFSIIRYPFWLFHKWRGSSSKKRQGQFGHSNKANPIVLIQTRLISYLVCTINAGYAASYFHIVLPNPERVATVWKNDANKHHHQGSRFPPMELPHSLPLLWPGPHVRTYRSGIGASCLLLSNVSLQLIHPRGRKTR